MDPAALATLSPEEQAAFMEALLEGPALEPPPGIIPDFANPGGHHGIGYGIVILGATLTAISVALRLYSRVVIKKINIEDGLLISALGLFAGHQYLIYDLAISPGIEVHQWNIQLKNLPPILYHVHLGSIFYGLVIMLLKAAILLDWLSLFVPRGQRNAMFWISHGLIWSNVLFYGVGTIVEIFQCTPREKIWNPLYEGGSCPIHMPAHMLASGIINLVSDIMILALPQKVIWKLHISTRNKVGVSLLFAVGTFACACAATRLVFLNRMLNSPDQLYTVATTGLWSIGEMTAGFLIIGIPSLPKAVQSIPLTESVISLIRSWKRIDQSGVQSNSRLGHPSWYKPQSRKRHNQTDYSDLDKHELISVKSVMGAEDRVPNAVTREFHVQTTNERRFDVLRTV